MTLEELKVYPKDVLTVEEVAPVIGVRPDNLRVQAREDPARLGFPVIVVDRTVRVPRLAFITWMSGGVLK